MTRPDADKAIRHPWVRIRRTVIAVQALALGITVTVALIISISATPESGKAFVVGGVIAGIPQLWFLVGGSTDRIVSQSSVLALGKMALSATGFAIWFGLRPEADPIVTLLGTATYIVAASSVMAVVSMRT